MSAENNLLSAALSDEPRQVEQNKNHNKQQLNEFDELKPQMMSKRRKPRGPIKCALTQDVTSSNKRAELKMILAKKSSQQTVKFACSRQATNRLNGRLALVGLVMAATLLLAVAAEHAQHQHQNGGYAGNNQLAQSAYGDQQPAHPKAKKIQIVYIKVPLAKLKPSLPVGANSGDYASAGSSQADNATNYASQHDATEQTKLQGSQSAADQQHQIAADADGQQQQQHSTFLIPMAVIQTPAESGPFDSQQQQGADGAGRSLSTASSYHAIHSQPMQPLISESRPSGGGRRSRQQQQQPQSPMQHYQQMLMSSSSPLNHGINHGFMSNFLLAEKEKMTAAAMRQMQQASFATGGQAQQVPAAQASSQSVAQPLSSSSPQQQQPNAASQSASASAPASAAAASSPAPADLNLRAQTAPSNNPTSNNHQQTQAANYHQKQGPGGLMPIMMMPFSMMPDNMIGQAYNAAVGQALPVESGGRALFSAAVPSVSLANAGDRPTIAATKLPPVSWIHQIPAVRTRPIDFHRPPRPTTFITAASAYLGDRAGQLSVILNCLGLPETVANGSQVGPRGGSLASGDMMDDCATVSSQAASPAQLNYLAAAASDKKLILSSDGSPASMLSSPSMAHADTGKQQRAHGNSNNNNNYGGNAGTGGDSNILHGTQSSGSYGSNGPSQQETSSLGNGYQHSASGFAASGPSSGYGSGINSFGASVAFSDYPAAPSTGSGQQMYAQQSSSNSISSNSNNNYDSTSSNNHQHSHSDQQGAQSPADSYTSQKLRQAKKTIIPIVVQVEHAIMENNGAALAASYNQNANQQQQQQQQRGNKYSGGRGHRQLGGKRANRYQAAKQQVNEQQAYRTGNSLFGAASNEIPLNSLGLGGSDAQYINAANAQDINKITAAINAENAASAAAALAQADMAFGSGAPAYLAGGQRGQMHQQQQRPQSQYASQLQSAASALLANTHPVIQAAASGGFASVSKLGAKLGEMIALPSMQVPSSISSIGSALPSALSSITNQVGAQLNQAVQQVAKEHPTAHAFARQVAQHAGLNLANFNGAPGQQSQAMFQGQQQQQQQVSNGNGQQQQAAASNQHSQSALSPQAQLQNLKLSIGQNLQTAAAQLMGAHQKANAQSAASLLANPLAALYPQSMNAALKQLSGSAAMQMSGAQMNSFGLGASNTNSLIDPHHAQSSSLVPVQQQMGSNGGFFQQQQQHQAGNQNNLPQSSDMHSAAQSGLISSLDSSSASGLKQTGKSTFKSKFLSFFQPPKFISNLLSWNDRADERNDQGELVAAAAEPTSSNGKSNERADRSEDKQQNPLVTGAKRDELAKVSARNDSVIPEVVGTTKAAPIALNTTTGNKEPTLTETTRMRTVEPPTATSLAPLNATQNAPKKS